MDRQELAELLLLELAEQTEAIRLRPRPPAWKRWYVLEDELDREFGPKYSPAWFGPMPDALRVRILRTIYHLDKIGLLTVSKNGGRLERLQLTAEGWKMVAELRASVPAPAAG